MARREKSELNPVPKFAELNHLERGGKILFATDDWFAAAENLLKEGPPEWKEGVFDSSGKWMDGWETRRKRCPGHDWSIIKLVYPGVIYGVDVDTSYFTGNYTPKISIQAANLSSVEEHLIPPRDGVNGVAASDLDLSLITELGSDKWTTIVEKTVLGPGYIDTCHNYIEVTNKEGWSHLRLNMYPDGGIARFRVYGRVLRDVDDIFNDDCDEDDHVDLVAMENGGCCIGYSDAHYGHPRNMILKADSVNMEDSWETARRLDRPEILEVDANGILQIPGSEWVAYRLGVPGVIYKVEVDTVRFIGNHPDTCKMEGCFLTDTDEEEEVLAKDGDPWHTILPFKKLGPNQKHIFPVISLEWGGVVSHIRLTMAPDGGIARLRVWGRLHCPQASK